MTPVEHLIALGLCTFAAWNTLALVSFLSSDRSGRVTVTDCLTILGPPLLLLILGVPIMTILGYLLAGTAILFILPFIVAILLSIARQGLTDTVRDLRDLARATAADYGVGTRLRAIANIRGTGHRGLVRPVIVAASTVIIAGASTVLAAIGMFLIQRVESATGLLIEFLVAIALTGVVIGMAHVLIPWWSIDRTIVQPILGAIGIVLGTAVVMIAAVDTVTTSAQMAVITIIFATGIGIGVQLTNFVMRPNFQAVVPDRAHYRSDEQSQSGTDRDVDRRYR